MTYDDGFTTEKTINRYTLIVAQLNDKELEEEYSRLLARDSNNKLDIIEQGIVKTEMKKRAK